ncbi:uncharacterized protein PHALS_01052 [Plasmopara halstedii]|uniref:Uncharacterized protein n=1 Tax=Plasmopara halstedii TaxID=4781 RepID=A0A0P1ASG0_PLAHL|nr:uncharacterized protein PHALS_01052 [Plasmopara halstedii]CEG44708.1 hypothetical protein PHALS_01052 [Plasmopara halstedii]|eukprot:XP_024581077.1 hypothetical protein PHALS_01052 [Plasmopara halstedii]
MLRTSVQLVVESQVGLKDDLTYKEIDWCTQKDGSSCGGWCLAILELLLAERPWRDCLYKVQSYLRLRYLYKAIWIQTSETSGLNIVSIRYDERAGIAAVSYNGTMGKLRGA